MFLKYNIPAFIWAVIILIIMAFPGDKLPELSFWQFIPFFDKWVHFGLFFIFSGLLVFGFVNQTRFQNPIKTGVFFLTLNMVFNPFALTQKKNGKCLEPILLKNGSVIGRKKISFKKRIILKNLGT